VQLLQHVDLKLGGIAVLVHVAYDLQRPSLAVSSLCHAHTHTNAQYVYLYYSKTSRCSTGSKRPHRCCHLRNNGIWQPPVTCHPNNGWQVTLRNSIWHVSSRSGLAMLHRGLLYLYTLVHCEPKDTHKLPPSHGILALPNTWFPGHTRVHNTNDISIASAALEEHMVVINRQTQRWRYVCSNKPHLFSACRQCGQNSLHFFFVVKAIAAASDKIFYPQSQRAEASLYIATSEIDVTLVIHTVQDQGLCNGRASVRLSVESIDSSNGGRRRVCCSVPTSAADIDR